MSSINKTPTTTPSVFKPFEPPSKTVPSTTLNDSKQIVTLPPLPELYNPSFLDVILPPQAKTRLAADTKPASAGPSNTFMDALRNDAGNRMLTDNMSPAYKSTLDPALNLFSTAANADGQAVHDLLSKSWAANAEVTLKLIFCLRSIHDGKSEKNTFYHAFGWLYKHHPRTAIGNLPLLVAPIIDRPPKKAKKVEGEDREDESDDWTEVEKEELQLPGYSHGYYKDLLNILVLAVTEELGDSKSAFSSLRTPRPWWSFEDERRRKAAFKQQSTESKSRPRRISGQRLPKPNPSNPEGATRLTKRQRRAQRSSALESPAETKEREAKAHYDRLAKALSSSPEFRALYVAVARIFAAKLVEDVETLKKLDEGNSSLSKEESVALKWKIGLVGKWAPTLGSSHDRNTNIATAIAQVLKSLEGMGTMSVPSFDATGQTPLSPEDALKVRGYYRRWIISPLRRQTQIPETYMSSNQWQLINYKRVPALCMRNSKKLFFEHDGERFKAYLMDVAKGKRSIAGGTLLPNELLGEAVALETALQADGEDAELRMNLQVAEGQWNSLVNKLRESGALGNCMAICDVSGSMGSIESYHYAHTMSTRAYKISYDQPIFPAVALSILVAQMAKPPFQNTFITFSGNPEVVTIDPTQGLGATARHMVGTSWGMNTDLQAVFLKLILPLAQKHNVPKEDMINRLFIFSDMQFDQCRANAHTTWTTDHQAIVEAYTSAGYDVPEIVYWNLSSHAGASKPVLGDTPGTALLSGFSGNLLKIFTESSEEELSQQLENFTLVDNDGKEGEGGQAKSGMSPTEVMMKAINKKSFNGLRVLD